MSSLLHTPLHPWHVSQGAQMVPFAGWHMPLRYTSIVEEHQAVRTAVGMFDISHMGRLRLDGPGVDRALDRLVTRRVVDMRLGQVRYSLVCDEDGHLLDDILIYRLMDAGGHEYFLVVANAANRQKVYQHFQQHLDEDISLMDLTQQWAMIAVQGPRALEAVEPMVEFPVKELRYYRAVETAVLGRGALVSRTGYTGEDGVEILVGAGAASEVWQALWQKVTALGGKAAGLGARDTLRLEAGMPLFGHELTANTHPFQAGLRFAVNLDRPFLGSDALKEAAVDSLARLVGLELRTRRVARQGYSILHQGQVVGQVTSGTFSPTLQKSIAMGYVQPALAQVGTELEVDLRGRPEPATVVPLPFYHRRKKGSSP